MSESHYIEYKQELNDSLEKEVESLGAPKILETYTKDCFQFSDHFLRMQLPKQFIGKTGIETSIETSIERGIERGIETVIGFQSLTPRQREVLELMLINTKITYAEMKERLNIKTDRGLSKHIEKLKEAGSIQRDQDFGGSWSINFENEGKS